MQQFKNIVIGVLAISIIYLLITGPGYKSKYDELKRKSAIEIEQLRQNNDKAVGENRELRETIDAMAGTISDLRNTAKDIGREISGAGRDNQDARAVIESIRADIEGQGQGTSSGYTPL